MDSVNGAWQWWGVRKGPGIARSDRGSAVEGFRLLIEDPIGFSDAVTALSSEERRLLAVVLTRDLAKARGASRASMLVAAAHWLGAEVDKPTGATLAKLFAEPGQAYRTGDVLWLVHGRGDALELRESRVRYHAGTGQAPPEADRTEIDEVRDEAARRIWRNRHDLPAAARAFAGFFD